MISLFLSEKYRSTVLKSLHDKHGHLGEDFHTSQQLVHLALNESGDKVTVIYACAVHSRRCPLQVRPNGRPANQYTIKLVSIDFLRLEPNTSGQGNIFQLPL